MQLYKINGNKILPIKEELFSLEKNLHTLIENNLRDIFGLTLVSREFRIHNFRIDTLAYDEEAKSFVVIEYKKDKNFSVIDQGYSYLALMLNNKSDFILEFTDKLQKNIKRDEVDWSQSRIMFVSPSFTPHQLNAINFKNLPIELWEAKYYNNDTISFNRIQELETSESISLVSKDPRVEKVSKEVKKYKVEDLLKPSWMLTKELFVTLAELVKDLDSKIYIKTTQNYLGFYIDNKMIFDVKPRKDRLLVELLRTRPENLKDPQRKMRYRKNSFEQFHQHISQVDIKTVDDIGYALFLIKQVKDKHF